MKIKLIIYVLLLICSVNGQENNINNSDANYLLKSILDHVNQKEDTCFYGGPFSLDHFKLACKETHDELYSDSAFILVEYIRNESAPVLLPERIIFRIYRDLNYFSCTLTKDTIWGLKLERNKAIKIEGDIDEGEIRAILNEIPRLSDSYIAGMDPNYYCISQGPSGKIHRESYGQSGDIIGIKRVDDNTVQILCQSFGNRMVQEQYVDRTRDMVFLYKEGALEVLTSNFRKANQTGKFKPLNRLWAWTANRLDDAVYNDLFKAIHQYEVGFSEGVVDVNTSLNGAITIISVKPGTPLPIMPLFCITMKQRDGRWEYECCTTLIDSSSNEADSLFDTCWHCSWAGHNLVNTQSLADRFQAKLPDVLTLADRAEIDLLLAGLPNFSGDCVRDVTCQGGMTAVFQLENNVIPELILQKKTNWYFKNLTKSYLPVPTDIEEVRRVDYWEERINAPFSGPSCLYEVVCQNREVLWITYRSDNKGGFCYRIIEITDQQDNKSIWNALYHEDEITISQDELIGILNDSQKKGKIQCMVWAETIAVGEDEMAKIRGIIQHTGTTVAAYWVPTPYSRKNVIKNEETGRGW